MTQAEQIIAKFGGISAAARLLGLRASTVQGWAVRGHVHHRNWEHVIEVAYDNGIDVTPADFVGGLDDFMNGLRQRAPKCAQPAVRTDADAHMCAT